jgi:hypothetical protein
MAEQDPLEEIQQLLQHDYVRERRKGVQQAAGFLAQGQYRQQLRDLVAKIAKSDISTNLAKFAQKVLDEDEHRHQKSSPGGPSKSPEYIVGAVCPKGHPNYYDKRLICKGEIRYRELDDKATPIDAIVVNCQTCGEEMKILVDCEGYK